MNEVTTTHPDSGFSGDGERFGRDATLTDRYIWAVVRDLPLDQRTEVDVELRSLIADMIEGGPNGARPEQNVLVELGDPTRLADRYRGSPRSLIGPELYPHWVRTTRLIASIVVPLIGVGSLVGGFVSGDGPFEIVTGSLWAAVIALVNVGFWSTLGFAVAERQGARMDPEPWTPDDLDVVPARSRPGLGDTIGSAVVALTMAALLVTQHLRGVVSGDNGVAVPFIDPEAWDGRAQVIVGALIGGAVVAVLARRAGWTSPLVAANLGSNLVLASVAVWLAASNTFVNTAFFDAIESTSDWRETAQVTGWVIAVLTVVLATFDSVESTVRWRRHRPRVAR